MKKSLLIKNIIHTNNNSQFNDQKSKSNSQNCYKNETHSYTILTSKSWFNPLILLLLTLSSSLVSLSSFAQDNETETQAVTYLVPKVALIDIEGSTISLNFVAPTEAGRAMTRTSDNSLWLNYSSTTASGHTNVIRACIDAVEPGVNIRVSAGAYSGNGTGDIGEPVGTRTLTTSNKNIIDDIGTCYTGNGANNGHALNYTLTVNNYSLIKATSTKTITVTYTITNN